LKEKVLFIVNNIYLDTSRNEGGVRNCTIEYINLLSTRFDVILFPVSYSKSIFYRIRIKLGLNNYNDYEPQNYKNELRETIIKNDIKYVFLNLSNTMTFASVIKEMFSSVVKVILCSHGNESGDFLHQSFRFKNEQSWLQRIKNPFLFAKMIEKEVDFRLQFLDLVLTISEVEEGIEKWLGAKRVFMVPRVLSSEAIPWNPVEGRIGFLGDLSHKPNFESIISFCDALSILNLKNVKFRVLGSPENIGKSLAVKYPFVEYCGFVPNERIFNEVGSCSIFLNLLFYYSRGVSTKLAKGLNWGIPVVSTTYGNRGYNIPSGMLTSVDTPSEMAELVIKLLSDKKELDKLRLLSISLANEFSDFLPIMEKLYPILISLQ
jgi:glycosyltransferase involved in cell wall biosynthesis